MAEIRIRLLARWQFGRQSVLIKLPVYYLLATDEIIISQRLVVELLRSSFFAFGFILWATKITIVKVNIENCSIKSIACSALKYNILNTVLIRIILCVVQYPKFHNFASFLGGHDDNCLNIRKPKRRRNLLIIVVCKLLNF